MNIEMVDLNQAFSSIQEDINNTVLEVVKSGHFIKGPQVEKFEKELAQYLQISHVISCGSGTAALQIALMALKLKPQDEVIIPSFSYAAIIEVIALLGLTPVFVDIDASTYNIDINKIEQAISKKTKVIVPVHLFGQAADMISIMNLAEKHQLFVIEDNAQSLGSEQKSENKNLKFGTIGHIGCTSFFPTKNLGCLGDGGAVMTNDEVLAKRIRKIANHGQSKKYHHDIIGVNSRLDTIQAAVLSVKLKSLDSCIKRRQVLADVYDSALHNISGIHRPKRVNTSTHSFHQYTIRVSNNRRNELKKHLEKDGVASAIYYPLPLHHQPAYRSFYHGIDLSISETLCKEVLSIPMQNALTKSMQDKILESISSFSLEQLF